MEVLKKTQRVELKHAKLTAAKMADEMLKEKLGKAREAYQGVFEHLCKQYESIMEELREMKEEKIIMKRRTAHLEQIITQQSNMIEYTGYKIRQ